jgi:hypothetical protein
MTTRHRPRRRRGARSGQLLPLELTGTPVRIERMAPIWATNRENSGGDWWSLVVLGCRLTAWRRPDHGCALTGSPPCLPATRFRRMTICLLPEPAIRVACLTRHRRSESLASFGFGRAHLVVQLLPDRANVIEGTGDCCERRAFRDANAVAGLSASADVRMPGGVGTRWPTRGSQVAELISVWAGPLAMTSGPAHYRPAAGFGRRVRPEPAGRQTRRPGAPRPRPPRTDRHTAGRTRRPPPGPWR